MPGSGSSARSRIVRRVLAALRLVPRVVRLVRADGLAGVRLACWTVRARRRVRRQLARGGMPAVRLPAPPPGADPDVMLRTLRRGNCLESALVRQRWYAAHGARRTVVIGVTTPSVGFHAHAWLDGETDAERENMAELLRHPAPENWRS